jgi:hypothetical protein
MRSTPLIHHLFSLDPERKTAAGAIAAPAAVSFDPDPDPIPIPIS